MSPMIWHLHVGQRDLPIKTLDGGNTHCYQRDPSVVWAVVEHMHTFNGVTRVNLVVGVVVTDSTFSVHLHIVNKG